MPLWLRFFSMEWIEIAKPNRNLNRNLKIADVNKLLNIYAEIELQTYNLALHNGKLGPNQVPRKSRRWHATTDIGESSADVVCLQEVVYELDMHHVRLKLNFTLYISIRLLGT